MTIQEQCEKYDFVAPLIAKNRNINDYESMSKDKLSRIIINNKRDRKTRFKSKKEETKKVFMTQKEIGSLN